MCKVWKMLMHPRVYMTVEPILLVFMFAQFLSYPVYQSLVRDMVCDRNSNCTATRASHNTTTSDQHAGGCSMPSDVDQEVQEATSHWILYTNLALGLPSIFFSILYGSISDQLGRKLFIFLPALGAALNTGVILEVAYLREQMPLYLCLIGAFSAGVYGGYPVLNSSVYSYASDVTAHSGRTRQLGLLESMTYLGGTLSLLVSGVWMHRDSSYVSIFWSVLACQVLVMLYTILALPESMYFMGHRSEERRPRSTYNLKYSQTHKFSRACGRFFAAIRYNIFSFFRLLLTNWRVSCLFLVFFVVEINFMGITDVVFLYSMGKPLCWDLQLIGYFMALKVFCNGLASLFLLPIMIALQFSDMVIIIIGLVSGGASLVLMGVATKTWIMFIVPVVAALRGCVVPSVRSMLSKQVPNDKQGILFSSVGVVESSCTLLASVIYNAIYPITRKIHPGLTFFIMAAALVIPMLIMIFLYITRDWNSLCTSCYSSKGQKSRIIPIEREPLLQ